MLGELKAERERRGLSLADMMRLTGMSRESISRLENDPAPNPTVLTFARYAAALGLELQFSAPRARNNQLTTTTATGEKLSRRYPAADWLRRGRQRNPRCCGYGPSAR